MVINYYRQLSPPFSSTDVLRNIRFETIDLPGKYEVGVFYFNLLDGI